jgi:hypothetical protein
MPTKNNVRLGLQQIAEEDQDDTFAMNDVNEHQNNQTKDVSNEETEDELLEWAATNISL